MMSTAVAELLRMNPKPQFWSTHDVRRWLESIGMDVYAPIFEAAGVTVRTSMPILHQKKIPACLTRISQQVISFRSWIHFSLVSDFFYIFPLNQGADLIKMDADILKLRLGVASLGHRTQLLQQIAVLSARATLAIKREGNDRSTVSKRKEVCVVIIMCVLVA
jgi:hypothetical protein